MQNTLKGRIFTPISRGVLFLLYPLLLVSDFNAGWAAKVATTIHAFWNLSRFCFQRNSWWVFVNALWIFEVNDHSLFWLGKFYTASRSSLWTVLFQYLMTSLWSVSFWEGSAVATILLHKSHPIGFLLSRKPLTFLFLFNIVDSILKKYFSCYV